LLKVKAISNVTYVTVSVRGWQLLIFEWTMQNNARVLNIGQITKM
jgi:hypothetical protein